MPRRKNIISVSSTRESTQGRRNQIRKKSIGLYFLLIGAVIMAPGRPADFLDGYKSPGASIPPSGPVISPGQFNGYTNHWHSVYWRWNQYGNLYQISHPDVSKSISQCKIDTAEELGIPGLLMEEGFLDGLLKAPYVELAGPDLAAVEKGLAQANLLVYADTAGTTGKRLAAMLPKDSDWRRSLRSHQLNARDFHDVRAFVLEKEGRKLFAVLTDCEECRDRLRSLVRSVAEALATKTLHRGWFGTGTLLHSVTCHPGHPLEVIGKGLSQGNDWFTFSGYMDYLLRDDLPAWLSKVGLDVVTDVGTAKATRSLGSMIYGCGDWKGIKIQDTPTEDAWIRFAKDRGGYAFRPVFGAECDAHAYDGYIAIDGNKKQIDTEDVPFILQTDYVREQAPPAMILFSPKGGPWTREAMWEAILGRTGVGILPQARMMGPEVYRNVLQMLWLDRVFIEDYFGDAVRVAASIEGREVAVNVANLSANELSGKLVLTLAPELRPKDPASRELRLPPYSEQSLRFEYRPTIDAMDRANPVLVTFAGNSWKKQALAVVDLPRVISAHQLLYGQAPEVVYPVSIHNYTDKAPFPVKLQVFPASGGVRPVFEKKVDSAAGPGSHEEINFPLALTPGAYTVKVSALGAENVSRLSVEAASGRARVYEEDLNGDGIPEFRMENGRVRVTLLAIGARVIEYIVKEKNDNVLFKLWPEKELATDKRPFRERGFYPYGGFEDFLGQASMETHKIYRAEIVRAEGPCAAVRMTADFYGNRLEKVFTLYGDSPLVEVRFALEFRNPEANMLGPQPILELGEKHGTEDLFVVPTEEGIREFRMRPEEYFGEVLHLAEGWNAGRDTVEDVSFVGAFPVSEPEFLHMWMNHPVNAESHHYYAEFQPWVPIFQKTVRYFSYYLWAAPGSWESGVEALRKRNLITTRNKDAS